MGWLSKTLFGKRHMSDVLGFDPNKILAPVATALGGPVAGALVGAATAKPSAPSPLTKGLIQPAAGPGGGTGPAGVTGPAGPAGPAMHPDQDDYVKHMQVVNKHYPPGSADRLKLIEKINAALQASNSGAKDSIVRGIMKSIKGKKAVAFHLSPVLFRGTGNTAQATKGVLWAEVEARSRWVNLLDAGIVGKLKYLLENWPKSRSGIIPKSLKRAIAKYAAMQKEFRKVDKALGGSRRRSHAHTHSHRKTHTH